MLEKRHRRGTQRAFVVELAHGRGGHTASRSPLVRVVADIGGAVSSSPRRSRRPRAPTRERSAHDEVGGASDDPWSHIGVRLLACHRGTPRPRTNHHRTNPLQGETFNAPEVASVRPREHRF